MAAPNLLSRIDSAGAALVLRLPSATRAPILAYHHVGPLSSEADRPLTIDPDRFAQQVAWLAAHGYRGVSAADWLDAGGAGARAVVLTFDDGYADLAEHAMPLLERHGFGATVFVVTGLLGGSNVWDHASGRARYELLDAEAIREWAARGIEFGAHTRTHRRLVGLSPAELRDEVAGSRDDLAAILGAPPRSFAYPYGDADADARRMVADLFDVAFVADEGRNTRNRDRHRLRRAGVLEADSRTDLALRVTLGWTPRHRVRQRVRRRLGRVRRRLGLRGARA